MLLKGAVLRGKGEGKITGFPSANILMGESKLEFGIYYSKVFLDNREYKGASYIGSGRPNIIETHILDFNAYIYDKEISLEIVEKIRDEIVTSDLEEIKKLIEKDIATIRTK